MIDTSRGAVLKWAASSPLIGWPYAGPTVTEMLTALLDERDELKRQLELANIDACISEGEANDLRRKLKELAEEASTSIEYSDWPDLRKLVEAALSDD